MHPGALEAAYLMAPIDVGEARVRFCDPLERELAEAAQECAEAEAEATAGDRFFDAWATRSWKEVVSAADRGSGPSPRPV